MEFIANLFQQLNDLVEQFIAPIVEKIGNFFLNGEYFILGLTLVFIGLLVLIGLIRWLSRAPKFFIFILILLTIVFGLWLLK